MRNFWVIFCREMKAYFTSPIAYIFVIVFVVLTCGLYMASFFLAERAEMRAFFSLLPIVLMVFVPAVTMRLWAEDKKMGTIELLLTFPMKSWQILLGKFFASLAFLTVALAGTLPLPIIVSVLGRPDSGPIIGGYVGSLLLGAFFLSLGLFISGLCKDQIVAFILSVIACFFFFFVGTDFFTTIIGGWLSMIATFLHDYVGLTRHFDGIQRGIIDARALIYFISMTVLFLALNAVYLEGRLRPRAKSIFAGALVLLGVAAVMVNVVASGFRAGRFDLTQGKMYTVSESARKVLKGLKDTVKVKYYVSPKDKMPANMKTIQQDVADKLEEFRIASNNMLQYKVYAYDPLEDRDLAERLDKKDIRPFQTTTVAKDEVSAKLVYSAIMISYAEKKDEIIPQVRPENFNNLEYELISRVFRLTLPEEPGIAMHAPVEELSPEMMQMFMRSGRTPPPPRDNFSFLEQALRGEEFNVSRVKLTKGDSIPEKANCVLIIQPQELNERQRYEINRALVEGKNVLLAVQNYTFDYRPMREGIAAVPQEVKPQINELIELIGVTVDEQFLMDTSNATLSVPSQRTVGGFLTVQVSTPVKLPTHIIAIDQYMNHDVSITDRLDSVLYLWGTRVNIDEDKIKEAGLKLTVLMTSSEKSWTVPFRPTSLMTEDITPPADKYEGKQPLMVMLSGQFPDAFKGKERPEWPPPKPRYPGEMPPPSEEEEEESEKPLKPKPGKLIVMGCSQMFTDSFIRSGGNALLTSNTVDALALGEELINIRSKSFTDRSIRKTSPGQKVLYRFLAMGLVPVLFIGVGVTRYILTKKGKERYLRSLASA
jgi:ABC-type uncharacterized transport system involved in gliding motility auxiliary subunit/ABC-type transport system involved in multi-copper enzyme maturation permease subunit